MARKFEDDWRACLPVDDAEKRWVGGTCEPLKACRRSARKATAAAHSPQRKTNVEGGSGSGGWARRRPSTKELGKGERLRESIWGYASEGWLLSEDARHRCLPTWGRRQYVAQDQGVGGEEAVDKGIGLRSEQFVATLDSRGYWRRGPRVSSGMIPRKRSGCDLEEEYEANAMDCVERSEAEGQILRGSAFAGQRSSTCKACTKLVKRNAAIRAPADEEKKRHRSFRRQMEKGGEEED
ncbi:hypothetical protein R3P38DRAFT_2794956 [Favolaschia claudopus]|uniref:Uncharacterized protein n=1 Tax=Favolaschia claudopus TaxID=2862362 RepID=A0AAW0A8B3_9AGAR